jgi:hypothetical protein
VSDLHVMPRGDLVEHAADDNCVCGPAMLREVRADGSDGWIAVHHALDGRAVTCNDNPPV